MKKSKKIIIIGIILIFCLFCGVFSYSLDKKIKRINVISFANIDYDTTNYIYLSDLNWSHAESGWKDARALKKDENESGDLISLIVNDEKTYFLKGVFAHATSEVIYDISTLDYDTFESYLGVDSSRGSYGNGVKFYIYVSMDGHDWILRKETGVLKGNLPAEKVQIDIQGYNYLKLVANNNGNQDSDHAVYADAKLYKNASYVPNTNTKVDFIHTVDEYDAMLIDDTNENILTNKELTLLQRTLVKRVGYSVLQAFATSDNAKVEMMEWLFNNKDILKTYITGGEPLGNYAKSLSVLSRLYHTYKNDLTSPLYNDTARGVFLKMMMAISLTHSSQVALWITGEGNTPVVSDPVLRYDAFKKLYLQERLPVEYPQTFDKKNFEALTVEEMRWVVDARLSDEEIPWLNWYSTNIENTKYKGRKPMDPYTYIWYDGSFDWRYTDPGYYAVDSTYCAPDIKNKFVDGYVRDTSCEEVYDLKRWGVGSNTPTKPRLWIIWEEDGVCGAISKTGENLHNSYGQVAAVTRQPAHAAYLIQTKTQNEDGSYTSTWSIGNDVSGWAKSSGTEKGERLPLNWGTTTLPYASNFNGSYVILAQRALDDFTNYEKALEYKLIADIYENNPRKQSELYRVIVGNPTEDDDIKNVGGIEYFNLDGWYGLIQSYLKDETRTEEEYYRLSYEIMANLKEFPLAMNDMLKLVRGKLTDGHKLVVDDNFKKILKELSNVPNQGSEYLQGQAVRQVAQNLLGEAEETISFSFDGENANKIVLATDQPFEYSLNYSYNAETEEVSGEWVQVTQGNMADLSNKIDKITAENDIVVHILVDDDKKLTSNSVTVIDIEEGSAPKNLYANELENKVIGVTNTMEWKIASKSTRIANDTGWVKFSTRLPDLSGVKTVLVREGATKTSLASDYVELTFEEDPAADLANVYIPIERLSATASTYEKEAESPLKAIDGHNMTIWHTKWNSSDTEKWIDIKIEGGAMVSKLDYMPRQDGSPNGRIVKAKIETSLDGEHYTTVADNIEWASDSLTKTYYFTTPVKANYVRLTGVETQGPGCYASAAMINLYENKIDKRIDVNSLSVSYIASGYTYNGSEHTPVITVKDEDTELVLNEHYSISYENNVNAGRGKIKITGLGIYEGELTKEFIIAKAQKPENMPLEELWALDDDKVLGDLEEYLPEGWSWEDPTRELVPGQTLKAYAVYKDRENYENTRVEISVYKENGHHPVITVNGLLDVYDMAEGEKDLEYFKSLVTINDVEDGPIDINSDKVKIESDLEWYPGTYHITITVTDNDGNKDIYVMEVTLFNKTSPYISIVGFDIKIDEDNLVYTGEEIKPTVSIKDDRGHLLTEHTNYTLEFSNNVNAGMATVKITGKGIYTGELVKQFEIKRRPVPTTLPDAKIVVSEDTTSIGSISLPEGWSWADEDVALVLGRNVLKVIYMGDNNHERYEFDMVVIRGLEFDEEEPPIGDDPSDPGEVIPPVPDKPSTDDNKPDNNSKPNTNVLPNDKDTDNKEKNPNTYDNILFNIEIGIISLIVLVLSTCIKIEKVK